MKKNKEKEKDVKKEKTLKKEKPEMKEDTSTEATRETAQETKENQILPEEFNKLKDDLALTTDQLLRTMAEFENFRRRSNQEKDKRYNDALVDVVEQWLPLVDNLSRAKDSIESLDITDEKVSKIAEGIDMVYRQASDILNKLSVDEIPSLGEQFNPELHNAVMQVDDDNAKSQEIVEVFQKGYTCKGRVIRHSIVKVAN